jgi:hypothetical protein
MISVGHATSVDIDFVLGYSTCSEGNTICPGDAGWSLQVLFATLGSEFEEYVKALHLFKRYEVLLSL